MRPVGAGRPVDAHALLRDAVCLQALWAATDTRAAGDEAEKLLAESISMIAANAWHACWEAPSGAYPAPVLHAVGQLGALARSRLAVLEEAIEAEDERRAFLVDQVGWLDSLAQEALCRLRAGLDGMFAQRGPGVPA